MTDRVFFDTNVLVYLFDQREGTKQVRAQELLTEYEGQAAISTQVLQEFFVTVTRKLPEPLSAQEVLEAIQDFSRLFLVAQVDVALVEEAIHLYSSASISFWDALIVRAARSADCQVLLTEDLQDGATLDGVLVRNPF